jgi:P-type Mg2+ transporter
MGTVVSAGSAEGLVVSTGTRTAFGGIAAGLGERHAATAFQQGLAGFSRLLVAVAAVLCSTIFVLNVVLGRPVLDALLFALAIAIGITPQLLPAIVTVSLSTGARRLAQRRIVVKRLVVIEDFGNVEVLFTDKTGTLTDGLITAALWGAPDASSAAAGWSPAIAVLPFDHDRRLVSVLVDHPEGHRLLITKGAPESVLARCHSVPATAATDLDSHLREGAPGWWRSPSGPWRRVPSP